MQKLLVNWYIAYIFIAKTLPNLQKLASLQPNLSNLSPNKIIKKGGMHVFFHYLIYNLVFFYAKAVHTKSFIHFLSILVFYYYFSKNQVVSGQNQFVSGQNQVVSGQNQVLSGKKQVVSGQNQFISGKHQVISGQNQVVSEKTRSYLDKTR